jgi:hypothetical protein
MTVKNDSEMGRKCARGRARQTRPISTHRSRQRLRRSEFCFERLLRLNRESDRHIGGAVEFLENLTAEQASILPLDARTGRQLDAAVAGMTGWTGEVGFLHLRNYAALAFGFPVRSRSHFLRRTFIFFSATCFQEKQNSDKTVPSIELDDLTVDQ